MTNIRTFGDNLEILWKNVDFSRVFIFAVCRQRARKTVRNQEVELKVDMLLQRVDGRGLLLVLARDPSGEFGCERNQRDQGEVSGDKSFVGGERIQRGKRTPNITKFYYQLR